MAREIGLTIIPALSKCDSPLARIEEVKSEIISLLNCKEEEIIETSGKTGEEWRNFGGCCGKGSRPAGEGHLKGDPLGQGLQGSPRDRNALRQPLQALVFDFKYSTHRGIIVFVRIMQGEVSAREI